MPKITFIGAGSTIFLRHILGDALLMPSLQIQSLEQKSG